MGISELQIVPKGRCDVLGHILRHHSLLKTMLEGRIAGTNTRGRPRMEYLQQIIKTVQSQSAELKIGNTVECATNQSNWLQTKRRSKSKIVFTYLKKNKSQLYKVKKKLDEFCRKKLFYQHYKTWK